MKIQNTAAWLITIVIVVTILIYGQPIIIPFLFAILIWFIVKKVRDLIDRVRFIRKHIPRWIKTILASFLIFTIIALVVQVLIHNIESIGASYLKYASNVELIANKVNELFKVDLNEEITGFVNEFNFSNYLQSFLNSISELIGNAVMIIFYIVFLFVEESMFSTKIQLIFPEKEGFMNYMTIIKKIEKSMSSYLSLKSLISLMTTTLSYFILLGVGIDSPLFWAFLIFIFNFIPSVGPILGTLMPALFSLIQFGEFVPFLIILFGVGTVAMLIGSLVEPKLMGNTLNISPLVAILALVIWGSIWGIVGMLLSVPITVVMIIIFSQFPSTRSVAILLSEKGRV